MDKIFSNIVNNNAVMEKNDSKQEEYKKLIVENK